MTSLGQTSGAGNTAGAFCKSLGDNLAVAGRKFVDWSKKTGLKVAELSAKVWVVVKEQLIKAWAFIKKGANSCVEYVKTHKTESTYVGMGAGVVVATVLGIWGITKCCSNSNDDKSSHAKGKKV